MISDLTVALLASVAVAVVPGWFWAGLLCATEDRAVRLACSVALSLALVPTAALVPARLFGFGVSLPVAIATPLVVFLAGLVAFLVLGRSKGPDDPLLKLPGNPLGLPALVLLALALAGSLATMLGVVPFSFSVLPVSILLVFSGLVYVLDSRRETEAQTGPPDATDTAAVGGATKDGLWRTVKKSLLPVVLGLTLLRGYLGPVRYDWPFIRGVDHYSHAVMANEMVSAGGFGEYLIYPPGFHTTIAVVSQLSGLRPLEVFPYVAPAFPALCALALYTLARRLWGLEAGVLAAAVCGLVLNGAYWYMSDSMYPNLIGAQFLLVMTLFALTTLYARPSMRSAVFLALLGSSIFLFHQVSSLYLALLLVPVSLFLLPYLFFRERRASITLFLSLALMVALSVLYVWDTYEFGAVIARAVGLSDSGGTGDAVGMAIGTQAPFPADLLVERVISQPVAWIGLFGLFLLFAARGADPVRRAAALTVLFWTVVLFAGSLTSLSGFPQRFGRDLGVPLSLLAAPVVLLVLRSLIARGVAAVFVTSLATLAMAGMLGLQAARNLEVAAGPPVRFSGNYGITTTPGITAAGDWLRRNNTGGNIMVSPQANQVPSRMMLAMGEYDAMQSYTEENLFFNRDLPPQGPGPLRDVLFAMYNPGDPRTFDLLERYDVRYIVHYKYMPDRGVLPFWRLAANYPELYRPVFENDQVLIIAPKQDADPAPSPG